MWEDEAHCGQHHSLGLVVLNYIKSGESKLNHTSMHAFIPSLFFSVCVCGCFMSLPWLFLKRRTMTWNCRLNKPCLPSSCFCLWIYFSTERKLGYFSCRKTCSTCPVIVVGHELAGEDLQMNYSNPDKHLGSRGPWETFRQDFPSFVLPLGLSGKLRLEPADHKVWGAALSSNMTW